MKFACIWIATSHSAGTLTISGNVTVTAVGSSGVTNIYHITVVSVYEGEKGAALLPLNSRIVTVLAVAISH